MKKSFLLLFFTLSFSLLIPSCGDDEDGATNLVLSETEWTVTMWDYEISCDILQGNGGYEATSSNSDIAEVAIQNNKVIVTSRSNGQAVITVKDREGKTATLKITVNGTGILAPSTLTFLNVGESEVMDILFKGFGGYTLVNNNEAFASAVLDGETIKLKGLTKGVAEITVTDKRGTSSSVTIYVFEKNELKALWLNTSISLGSTYVAGSIMEDGEYEAISADPTIATAEMKNGRNVSVKGLKVGSTTITVRGKNGRTSVSNIQVNQ